MLTRSRLRPVSKKKARQNRAQAKAYEMADDAEQCWCSVCGKPGATDHSHHFTQGRHQSLANDQRNWLKLCRADHDLFENKKAEFAKLYPEVWAQILSQMEEVSPQDFAAFRLKNPF